MSTQATTKTKAPLTKKSTGAVVKTLVPAGQLHSVETKSTDAPYDLITALNLKRSKLTPALSHKVNFYMTEDQFRGISMIGIKHGVSFDEALKGLIERELAGNAPGAGLDTFIPVLNL